MKQTILTTAILLLSAVAPAQHHLSATAGAAPSTLMYTLTEGKKSLGFGGYIGGSYRYFFNQQWAIGTGLEFALYNAKATLPANFTDHYMTRDMDGDDFDFQTTITTFEERQTAFMLQIPIMAHFETKRQTKPNPALGGPPIEKPRFYAAAGVKVGIPVTAKYNTSASFNNVGYYEFEDYPYNTDRFMGFGAFSAEQKDKLDLGVAVLASAELGMRWALQNNRALYAGIYFDYGLNNIHRAIGHDAPPLQSHIVGYNTMTPTEFTLNPILTSHHAHGDDTRAFTEKVSPMAIGLTVRLAFGCKQKERTAGRGAPSARATRRQTASSSRATTPRRQASSRSRSTEAPASVAQGQPQSDQQPETSQQPTATPEQQAAERAEARRHAIAEVERTVEAARQRAAEGEDYRRLAAIAFIQREGMTYEINQYELTPSHLPYLDKKIKFLNEFPDMKVHIYGHTCDLGTREVNERIGMQRAQKVRDYLVSQGIDPSRIVEVGSKRDTEPVAPNTSAENRKKNHRVQFVVE